ncbi:thyroglobulin [Gastrophryne carolinensis]
MVIEYEVDSQPLLPCELAREKAHSSRTDYIPQCSEDGLYRKIQCSRNATTCWCVDSDGTEVVGSRVTGSPPICLSFCQLRKQKILVSGYINSSSTSYIPRCTNSGQYEDVQCDQQRGECWCVDNEGMEIYGTRQIGETVQCPNKCAVRNRRILHDVGEKVPPHCTEDGGFQPVQCKLVNTTDQMAVDLVTTFSRFPDAFRSFSSMRESFPEFSGYCYCADQLGRELAGTGVELLLDEIYDTVFSTLSAPRMFTETTIHRILQRRFLGVQLITSGRFRCPSTCEIQRFTASQMGDVYVPTCDENGGFQPVQSQEGRQAWCVDSKGREIYGSRVLGRTPNCASYQECPIKRRQALSTLFFGPSGHFGQESLFITQEEEEQSKISSRFCSSYIVETFANSGLQLESKSLGLPYSDLIADMINGLFQSKEQIQLALKFASNSVRFQENLFGGKYLKNLGLFNFTGSIGTKSKFSFSDFFQQIGLTGLYSGGNFKELAKLFSSEEDSYASRDLNASKPVFNLNQPILTSFGRTVNLEDNQKRVSFFSSILERRNFLVLLRDIISLPSNIAEDVSEALKIMMESKYCQRNKEALFVPTCTKEGSYEQIQCSPSKCWCVDEQGREVQGSQTVDRKPKCPSKCETERESQILLRKSQPAGSDLFITACDKNGDFVTAQCASDKWFCMDLEGRTIPGTETPSGENLQCPSYCQMAASSAFLKAVKSLLTSSEELSDPSKVYIPQCTSDGEWRPVQCNGPTEQVFNLYERWTTLKNISFQETLQILLQYKELTSQSFSTFVQRLYDQGHQKVFPVLSQYSSFGDIPEEWLAGNITTLTPDKLLLNPYVFWRFLSDSFTHYPGSYSDFSLPLGHINQRSCWCVDPDGQKLPGKDIVSNRIPTCPGSCEMAKLKSAQFVEEARNIMAASNASNFPLGYNFLLANGVRLSERELTYSEEHQSGIKLSESLLKADTYGLRLAAYSTLKVFQQSGLSGRETDRLSYLPYSPQCDGLGNWDPVQFYPGTGHYWCVDNKGNYIDGSLASRTNGPPKCQTSCQQAATKAQLSSWFPSGSSLQTAGSPKCTETGQYIDLQSADTGSGCVGPSCNETLSRVLCDREKGACYCVFPTGEEAPGTRVSISEMSASMCQAALCPLPFGILELQQGSVFCSELEESGEKWQRCRLVCRDRYVNVFSTSTFMCNLETQRWEPQAPHLQSCHRAESYHVVQSQAGFQLLLPPGKMCTDDYSGLLEAFRTFILDDLKARGLCHIQVDALDVSESVAVCDDSTVYVKCLTSSRMGVNITWTARVQEIPESVLPTLHDVENALADENLDGRLLSIIRSGSYSLNLDSKLFVADKSDFFPQESSPQVRLGCARGFRELQRADIFGNSGGCGICPAGSYFQDGNCLPCPLGFYQEKAGSGQCQKCPLGTTTAYTGAYNQSYCVTRCQANTRGLQCDERGQFLASQKDRTTEKYYCADHNGEKLLWTENEQELSNDQCLVLQKFELVAEDQLIVGNENVDSAPSTPFITQKTSLLECIQDCAEDESCDYVTVSGNGTGIICEQYIGEGSNVICSSDTQVQTALGNSAGNNMEGLRCQYKVKLKTIDRISVYRKKGEEFPSTGHKDFKRTNFGNALSGVYSTFHFPGGKASLTDVYYMCRQMCGQDACCHGFILSQILLNKGTTICGLMKSPNALLCNKNDWRTISTLGGEGVCKGVQSNKEKKMFSFFLGGQTFTGSYSLLSESVGMVEYSTELTDDVKAEIQERFIGFQRVFLSTDGSVQEFFLPVTSEELVVNQDGSPIANAEYWISKDHYKPNEALNWCLSRCKEEESWCRLADLRDTVDGFFTCIIYPDTWKCNNVSDASTTQCNIMLNGEPQSLYHRREAIGNKVKHFYTLVPYRKLSKITIRNRLMVSGVTVSQGFFQCELHCDADPCCRGFGYTQRPGTQGLERICVLLASLGIKSCAEDTRSTFAIANCSSPYDGMETSPFGWYQKPEDEAALPAGLCPQVDVLKNTKPVSMDEWLSLDRGSVILDPSVSSYDTLEVSRGSSDAYSQARDYCLSECLRVPACVTTTLHLQQEAIKCTFYPETQTCSYSLNGHHCRLLLREPATDIFRKRAPSLPLASVTLPGIVILGKSQTVLIGSDVKTVHQFLGVPYADPPTGENRFRPPQSHTRTGTWNATSIRSSCIQPGDGKAQYSSVSEDCLYLNVFVPQNARPNIPVLLFFYNSPSDYSGTDQTFMDGSFQAAVGDIIVVTAGYRVGVFGFLSTSKALPNGNWGLLDQSAALKWVQENIAHFGGDPEQICIGAERAGADIASILLLLPENRIFRRAALMGGSAFSPMFIVSEKRAQEQVTSMAEEVGCATGDEEATLMCLRSVDAIRLNEAQTKLLAIRGPFQIWGPVVDGVYLKDTPTRLLQQKMAQNIDLLIGSSEHDGLISRAKAIKRFEESQGRGESKMAFYRALQNSLGGEEMNPLVQEAAVWFYSLRHSTDDYSSFSRALENATRDHFITCPAIKMADHWSENSKGHVYMYHVPETYSQSSLGLNLPEDVMYAFGIPFHSNHRNQFPIEEKELSLQIMQYLANFVKTGNPNFPYTYSRRRSGALPAWPEYRVAQSGSSTFKEFTRRLPNDGYLKNAECSFWNDYIPALKVATRVQSAASTQSSKRESASAVTQPKGDGESYN